jgi:hypothetical protein
VVLPIEVRSNAGVHQLRRETIPRLAAKKCGQEKDYKGKGGEWCRSVFVGSVVITARETYSKC